MYIPLLAISSGGSFGFFMGIGMLMRSEMEGKEEAGVDSKQSSDYQYLKIDPLSGEVREVPMYRGYLNL